MKEKTEESEKRPKKLFCDNNNVTTNVTYVMPTDNEKPATCTKVKTLPARQKSQGYLDREIERLKDENDSLAILIQHKKNDLNAMKSTPTPPKPLAINGGAVTKTVCDNYHHRGHKPMEIKATNRVLTNPAKATTFVVS